MEKLWLFAEEAVLLSAAKFSISLIYRLLQFVTGDLRSLITTMANTRELRKSSEQVF